jgi:hypothetical protein
MKPAEQELPQPNHDEINYYQLQIIEEQLNENGGCLAFLLPIIRLLQRRAANRYEKFSGKQLKR